MNTMTIERKDNGCVLTISGLTGTSKVYTNTEDALTDIYRFLSCGDWKIKDKVAIIKQSATAQ